MKHIAVEKPTREKSTKVYKGGHYDMNNIERMAGKSMALKI